MIRRLSIPTLTNSVTFLLTALSALGMRALALGVILLSET